LTTREVQSELQVERRLSLVILEASSRHAWFRQSTAEWLGLGMRVASSVPDRHRLRIPAGRLSQHSTALPVIGADKLRARCNASAARRGEWEVLVMVLSPACCYSHRASCKCMVSKRKRSAHVHQAAISTAVPDCFTLQPAVPAALTLEHGLKSSLELFTLQCCTFAA
jgi:hypothetical protein